MDACAEERPDPEGSDSPEKPRRRPIRGRARRVAVLVTVIMAAASPVLPAGRDLGSRGPAAAQIGSCILIAPPGHGKQLEALAEHARTILPEVEEALGVRAAAPYRMFLVPPEGPSEALRRLDAGVPPWAAGYMLPAQRLGAIRTAEAGRYPYGTLESVLAHEATHMLLHDAVGDRLPLWFEEGVATWQGRKWSLEDILIYSSSLLTTDLPALADLDESFHGPAAQAGRAYAAAFSFVSWSTRRYGPGLVRNVLAAARSRPFEAAWKSAAGETLDSSEGAWRKESLIRYRWIPVVMASSPLWVGISFLALVAGARRRARAKAARARWADEETETETEEVVPEGPGTEGAAPGSGPSGTAASSSGLPVTTASASEPPASEPPVPAIPSPEPPEPEID